MSSFASIKKSRRIQVGCARDYRQLSFTAFFCLFLGILPSAIAIDRSMPVLLNQLLCPGCPADSSVVKPPRSAIRLSVELIHPKKEKVSRAVGPIFLRDVRYPLPPITQICKKQITNGYTIFVIAVLIRHQRQDHTGKEGSQRKSDTCCCVIFDKASVCDKRKHNRKNQTGYGGSVPSDPIFSVYAITSFLAQAYFITPMLFLTSARFSRASAMRTSVSVDCLLSSVCFARS